MGHTGTWVSRRWMSRDARGVVWVDLGGNELRVNDFIASISRAPAGCETRLQPSTVSGGPGRFRERLAGTMCLLLVVIAVAGPFIKHFG